MLAFARLVCRPAELAAPRLAAAAVSRPPQRFTGARRSYRCMQMGFRGVVVHDAPILSVEGLPVDIALMIVGKKTRQSSGRCHVSVRLVSFPSTTFRVIGRCCRTYAPA